MKSLFGYLSALVLLIVLSPNLSAQTQSPIDGVDARTDANQLARQLGDADPLLRQKSAEALAKLAATSQRKVVEGYHIQEKNKEVRLAMEWALYRMGRAEMLYRIVDELDSGRQKQAIGYLSEVDSPEVLYPFLQKQNSPPRVTTGLLKALGRVGDGSSLDLIKPYRESLMPNVAEAAEIAHDEIEKRLGEPTDSQTRVRPRTVAKP
jgi:HEAT repeat protein